MKKDFFEIGGFEFVTYYHLATSELLCEAKSKGHLLIKNCSSYRYHHEIPDGMFHIHVCEPCNKIFALSIDRSYTDNYQGLRIFNLVFLELVSKYDGLLFKPKLFIETYNYTYFLQPICKLSKTQLFNELEILRDAHESSFELNGKQLSQRIDDLYMELVKRKAIKLKNLSV
jgi:hypothetical protein